MVLRMAMKKLPEKMMSKVKAMIKGANEKRRHVTRFEGTIERNTNFESM